MAVPRLRRHRASLPFPGRPARPGALALAAAALLLLAAPRASARILLLGMDGASWSVIDPLVEAGEMPHLAALLERGASADLETVEPVVSPVVWTSLATGRSPEAHGVFGFLATRLQLRTPTVFERLSAAGLRVGLYDYLVTWPPPALPDGFAVPGWMRRDARIHPPDLWTRTGVDPYVVEYNASYSNAEHRAGVLEELARKPATFLALARAWDADVAATIVYAPDRTSHRFWREAFPGDEGGGGRPALPRAGSLLREAMHRLDAGIGAAAAGLGPDDVLLLASDHGFRGGEPRAVWVARTAPHLTRAGLDEARDAFSLVREWGAVVVRVHPGPFAEREPVLERLVAFYQGVRGPDGEPLMDVQVLDGVERPPGYRRSWWERLWQWGFRKAARYLASTSFDDPAHAWVVARFDADRMQALYPDGRVRIGGRAVRAGDLAFREEFDGVHDPVAVFAAAGGPVRALPRSPRLRLSVLDVAPLILHLAGQPLPDDLEGRLPEEILDPAWLAAHPPRRIPAARAPRLEAGGSPTPAPTDPETLERLRSLGYLD